MEYFGNIMINIRDWLRSCIGLKEKVQTLKRKCDTLCSREADILAELQHTELSCRKKRRKTVKDWLENVGRTRNGVEGIEIEVSTSGILGRKQLADRAEDLTREVSELMEQGQFREGLTLDAHDETIGDALLTSKLVGKAFQRNLEIIWEHLRKVEVLSIGIWGMGGVGKTSLAMHIYNRVRELSDTFNHVYWITVAQSPSISKLQDDIARAICLDISKEDDERKRAAKLSEELAKRTRSVLILDDLWDDIHLERIGIDVAVNGCKLVITTRSLEVCRKLGCQEKIKIEPLSEEEAWYLFKSNLGHQRVALSPQILEVAMHVARECAGLPLGIITVARCMKEVNDVREWRDALQALLESKVGLIEMEEEVFQVLKFSYNRLNDPKVQQCFLYCALFREDYEIRRENLIQLLIDEGLVERMRSRQAEFDRGHTILNKLVNCCLLEAVGLNNLDSVKMHDLVRDMAIKMMSPQFMVRAGMQLSEVPVEQEWSEDVERVSLIDNKIEEIALDTSRTRCPKLLTLLLSHNRWLKRIQSTLFEQLPVLQVLDLSHCAKIEELPNSVSNLKNLSALILHRCSNLQRLPSLAKLKSLKRLDLAFTAIRELPHGLERLINLTYLDLNADYLEEFPPGILPKLSRLEYLKFNCRVLNRMKINGQELTRVERLSTFQGHLIYDDVNGFKTYFMSSQRCRGPYCSFYFVLDDGYKRVHETYRCEDNLYHLKIKNWSISKRAAQEDANVDVRTLKAVLKDVQSLHIESCNDARSLYDVSCLDNATPNVLKRCHISHCKGIECVGTFSTSSSSSSSPSFLQNVEILQLSCLWNLRELFELEGEGEGEREGRPPIPPPFAAARTVFSCLKQFCLCYCPKIKKLFPPGFLPILQNLQEIHVYECDGLEEIIAAGEEDNNGSCNVQYSLPKLRILSLIGLRELKSICVDMISCDSLSEIKVGRCPKLKKLPFSSPLSSLQSITVDPKEWWQSVEWNHHIAKSLLQPYLHFRSLANDIEVDLAD